MPKTLKIKDLLKKELLIIELPEKYNLDYTYYREDDETEIAFYLGDDCVQLKLFKGSYTLLGKPDEIKEEDAKELIQKIEYDFGTCYRHYSDKTVFAKTATESLLSAIETVVYWDINPMGEEPILEAICCGNLIADEMGFHGCCGVPNATEESIELHSMWHEAESRTFDKKRTLIFVKN